MAVAPTMAKHAKKNIGEVTLALAREVGWSGAVPECLFSGTTVGSAFDSAVTGATGTSRASSNATEPAITFNATAIASERRRPSAGRIKNPAVKVPATAPAV